MSFKWCLKAKMAEKGIWRCTDLQKLLKSYGFNMSVSMVTRIVEKMPERINTQMLDALCDILHCSPSDIMVHTQSNVTLESLVKVAGESIGIKPGPKPQKPSANLEIPPDILGPRGGIIK